MAYSDAAKGHMRLMKELLEDLKNHPTVLTPVIWASIVVYATVAIVNSLLAIATAVDSFKE